jgi:type IV pilus assembly protein PilC
MFYPAVVGAFILFIMPLLAIFLIPRMAAVYNDMGNGLPAPTRLLLGATDLIKGPWGAIGLLAVLLLGMAYSKIRKTGPGRRMLDRFVRSMPFFGRLSKQAELWRFCRTVPVLLKAGVPLSDALKLVSATSQNAVMKSAIDSIQQGVSQGESLGDECRRTNVFPENMVWIIAMGEERGTLNEALQELAEFYDLEVCLVSEKIQSLIEPALVACLGGIVAVVLIALYMPIFNMAGVFGM